MFELRSLQGNLPQTLYRMKKTDTTRELFCKFFSKIVSRFIHDIVQKQFRRISRRTSRILILLGVAGILCTACKSQADPEPVSSASGAEGTGFIRDVSKAQTNLEGYYFDTIISIQIFDQNAHALAEGCDTICRRMEAVFSPEKVGGELYKLNHRTKEEVPLSDDLAACLGEALDFAERTEGAYDPTVLPLTELWNFSGGSEILPKKEEIQAALSQVDYRKVHLRGKAAVFDSPEIRIDLGSAAKGYISKKLKDYLEEKGCTSALIDLGHNIRTLGTKTDGSDWMIGLQMPFEERGTVLDTIAVRDQAVISSGTYERFFEKKGKRYHHILDPKTGYPVMTDLNMATVVGNDDTVCDILSTVCILLGKEQAEAFLEKEKPGVEVCLTDTSNHYEWHSYGNNEQSG